VSVLSRKPWALEEFLDGVWLPLVERYADLDLPAETGR
jgi:hypothetical protein